MRVVALLVLVFGVALAGGAIFFASEYFRAYEASLARRDQGPELTRVIAAKAPLDYGDVIKLEGSGDSLRWVEWPSGSVPEGAFTSLEDLLGDEKDQIRTVLRKVEPGELILKSKVTGFGERPRVAAQVAEGKRAFTISINAASGGAGLIAPGDRVDILLTRSIERQLMTSTLLQNVRIIAMDQTSDTESDTRRAARTATVEVEPRDAQTLALAQQTGKLSLILRGMTEEGSAEVGSVGVHDLPDQPEQAKPKPKEEASTVRVRKGSEVSDVEIQ
ncbi:MAG: Flp pilus assembly protein CpaB [Pseudomonadota bacterium]